MTYDSEKEIASAYFDASDTEIKSIFLPFDGEGVAVIHATDEGNEHPYALGEIAFNSNDSKSGYAFVDLAGRANSLIVEVPHEGDYVDDLATIMVNVAIPFDISIKRTLVILLGIMILLAWGSRSFPLLSLPFRKSMKVNIALWLLVAIPTFLILVFVSFPCNIQTGTYDSFQHHEYFELAKSLAQGHVYLDLEVSPELASMENPYDTVARERGMVPFYWDYAYFQGRYYSYFGVLPCLLYHLPFYFLTGGELLNEWAVLFSILFLIAGTVYLLNTIVDRWFPGISWGTYLFGYAVLIVGSWGIFRIRHANLYSVPIVTGLACAVFAVAFWISSTRGSKISLPRAVMGTLCASLTLACRPQLFLVSVFGLVLFLDAMKKGAGRGAKTLVVFSPLVVVGVFVCLYNYLRFGSLLDFGASYNLTTNDMTHRGFSIVQSFESLYYYLVSPLSLSASYPYVNPEMPVSWSLGLLVTQGLPGGILLMTPVLVTGLLLFTKSIEVDPVVRCMGVISLALALFLIVFDGMGAGILVRYFSDFGFFIALPAVFAQLALFQRCECMGGVEHIARIAMTILLSVSVVLQLVYAFFSPVY
ncbi:MAG: hypothetical protein Q4D92_01475 [Slackia sp.]|nr:hypothetical protein [Slackia sp.]